ncbi:hypothetical protein ACP70R_002696 [Stipagrostis hirtigluma subsp. patula]
MAHIVSQTALFQYSIRPRFNTTAGNVHTSLRNSENIDSSGDSAWLHVNNSFMLDRIGKNNVEPMDAVVEIPTPTDAEVVQDEAYERNKI